jgi:hypothetical protein
MDEHIETLYRLRNDIESIPKDQQHNLLNYMTLNNLGFTENENGVFFNLSVFSELELAELHKFVETLKNTKIITSLPHPNREILRLPGVDPADWKKYDHEVTEEEMPTMVDELRRRRPQKVAKPTKQQQRMMKRMREVCNKRATTVRQRRRVDQSHETEDNGFIGLDDDEYDCEDYEDYDMPEIEEVVDDVEDDPELEDYGGEEEPVDIDFHDHHSDVESEVECNMTEPSEFQHNITALETSFSKIPTSIPLADQWNMFINTFPKLKKMVVAPQWM